MHAIPGNMRKQGGVWGSEEIDREGRAKIPSRWKPLQSGGFERVFCSTKDSRAFSDRSAHPRYSMVSFHRNGIPAPGLFRRPALTRFARLPSDC